jgi:hypothetical protein
MHVKNDRQIALEVMLVCVEHRKCPVYLHDIGLISFDELRAAIDDNHPLWRRAYYIYSPTYRTFEVEAATVKNLIEREIEKEKENANR